jgi:glycosyltransferase involved in cell wall biosynthesis
MRRIAYITTEAPFGRQETFIIGEMLSLKRLGADILIAPRDFSREVFQKDVGPLLDSTMSVPLLNAGIAGRFLKFIITRPVKSLRITKDLLWESRGAENKIKNLIVMPKAVYLSGALMEKGISHIHAHWGTTTSTIAYIISRLTGIPWSMTCHRGDIQVNNLLGLKCRSASFVRAIDEQGKGEILRLAEGMADGKVSVMHMGVTVPQINEPAFEKRPPFAFICPANFVPKKGHRYLIEACRMLSDKGADFKCVLAGDGPLESEIKKMAQDLGLNGKVEFAGRVANAVLLKMYGEGSLHALVLPSILTEDGQREGIPVALMEAMAHHVPVISTDTGGIPELIGDGSGVMIREKDPKAIAEAILRLMGDASFYREVARAGRKKVERDFNEQRIAREMLKLFKVRAKKDRNGKAPA